MWGFSCLCTASLPCSESPLPPSKGPTSYPFSPMYLSLASSSFKHAWVSHFLKTKQYKTAPPLIPYPSLSSRHPSTLPLFLAKSVEKHGIFTVFTPSCGSETAWRFSRVCSLLWQKTLLFFKLPCQMVQWHHRFY